MNTRRRWQLAALGTGTAAALVAGSAVATTPGSSTDVTFVAVNHRVLNAASVGVGRSTSPVVIGGSTTVPTDATTVRLLISVKSIGSGHLTIYPAGNPAGASGDTVTWAGTKGGGGQIAENIGTSNQVTFVNNSTASIALTVTITGYSTQVSAGDISGQGGSAGQVLTNDGAGGASWQTPGTAYEGAPGATTIQTTQQPGYTEILGLPAGHYLVQVNGTVEVLNGASSTAHCELVDVESGAIIDTAWASVAAATPDASIGMQTVATSTSDGGGVGLRCIATALTRLAHFTLAGVGVGTVVQR
jgi:hypothetical protein